MNKIDRRAFLRGLGVAGAVAVVRSPAWALGCPGCGESAGIAHRHVEHGRWGVYCPHCALERDRLVWDVDRVAPGRRLHGVAALRAGQRGWSCVEVPFPNPELVPTSMKPRIKLSDIRW